MIELLTVLVLIGVTGSLVAPRISLHQHAVNAAAHSTGSTLLRAQRRAVQQQHDVVVAFDLSSNRLRIHDDRDGDRELGAGEAVSYEQLDEAAPFGRGGAPGLNSNSGEVTFSLLQDEMPAVVFSRNGSASEEGAIYLTSQRAAQGAGYESDTRVALIRRSPGRTEWYRYEGSGWKQNF